MFHCFICISVQAELLDPAVKGTLNVLGSCKKASITKVVITSSMAAVSYNEKPRTPEVTVDETWFTDPQICEKTQVLFLLSTINNYFLI
jgi:nucleoside-diphosphate-sugar epimerase